jgi:hypothetical protein
MPPSSKAAFTRSDIIDIGCRYPFGHSICTLRYYWYRRRWTLSEIVLEKCSRVELVCRSSKKIVRDGQKKTPSIVDYLQYIGCLSSLTAANLLLLSRVGVTINGVWIGNRIY